MILAAIELTAAATINQARFMIKKHGGYREGAGRKTDDPKGQRITLRLAERDTEALAGFAQSKGLNMAEAARLAIRRYLKVPQSPKGGAR